MATEAAMAPNRGSALRNQGLIAHLCRWIPACRRIEGCDRRRIRMGLAIRRPSLRENRVTTTPNCIHWLRSALPASDAKLSEHVR